MRHHLSLAVLTLCLAPVLVCCSVKEDRVPCPSYLKVSFEDRPHIDSRVGLLGWDSAELFRDTIDVADYDPYWIKAVRKGELTFSAYRSKGVDAAMKSHYVVSPEGFQADSLYGFHTKVDVNEEVSYVNVSLKKQFCTVFLDIRRSATEMRDFTFRVNGNTCGFDVLNFEPVPGLFNFSATSPAGDRIVPFRIYRQMDDSISVIVYKMGGIVGSYPLGVYIRRMGYNWDAEELQDIYVVVDLVEGQILISVEGWEEGAVFPFIEQ